MIVADHFGFVLFFLSLWGNFDTAELNEKRAPPPVALSSPNNDSNSPQLKSVTENRQPRPWNLLPLDYWEAKVSDRNFSNLLFETKAFETDLNSCMKTPTTSCVIKEAYVAANNINNAWRRDFSLIFVVGAQTAFGDIDGALQTIGRIESSNLRLPARLAVAKEHVARQNIPEATRITNKVLKNISIVEIAYIRTWVFALSASVFAEPVIPLNFL